MKWSKLPIDVRDAIWSSGCLPDDWDYDLKIQNVDVGPLYSALALPDSDSGMSEFEACQVYNEDFEDLNNCGYSEEDLKYPIIIDRRLPSNVADGMHRIMLANKLGVATIPAIDITDMFIAAGMPEARNDYRAV